MTFSIFRYAALNKLSEDSSDSDADEVQNIIPGPVDNKDSTANDDAGAEQVFESGPKNTEIKNNFEQNDLGPTADDDVKIDINSENKSETHKETVTSDVKIDSDTHVKQELDTNTTESHVEPKLDTKIKGGDQVITYDVSFISAFPFIVAKAV